MLKTILPTVAVCLSFLFPLEPIPDIPIPEKEVDPVQLSEELKYGEMEYLAIMVYAEAGNQDLDGMRLVADVILNRVDDERFPDNIYDVLYQPGQFGPAYSGGFEKAAMNVSEEAFQAAEMEWDRETRLDQNVLWFNTTWDNGSNPFKHGDHWFSY